MKHRLRKWSDESGQGLVEFAIVLPIFLLLLLAMLDLGWLLNGEITVNADAKEAARIIIVADGKTMAEKKANAATVIEVPKESIAVSPAAPASGAALSVTVTKRVTPLVGFWIKGEQVLTGTATMRME